MTSGLSLRAIASAQEEYDRLQFDLKEKYPNHFVAIDPYSKRYFIGYTLAEAMRNGRNALPNTEFYGFKIGSDAAMRF